ncbi:tripartite tricarboxylate transporter substrate binding protein [Ramlibacter sp. G-1-2-2]|uniref:Tripartite tricarboxylate transporter substrate binding protein n=1 Tax=Ramlibacter agri TaxID=2728837 RepID=A0A848H9R3_9BURK|nr:tripartite tricarboxylate transporter substrate binding protein [Ramlibacter agri]NML46170.1 tripartite tricarboxylate transporter substrate binding protein [Ramlibacter agri]
MQFGRFIAAAAASLVLAASAFAQAYPQRPVIVVVPFVPGGSSDTTMRTLSARMGESLGQSVVLDNKPGANGTLGAGLVVRAQPDGYTLLIGSVGTYAISPQLLKSVTWDARKDLDMLAMPVRTPNVVVVAPSFPANTIAELVEYMKKHPGQVSFASAGTGSTDHLSALLLWQKTGTQGVHVPYKGGGAAITDVMGNHSNVLITNLGVLTPHIKAGKLKALAVTSAKRVPELPDVPTLTELGLKGLEIYSWQGVAAPKGLPPAVRTRIVASLNDAMKDPQARKSLEDAGFEMVSMTPAQAATELNAEINRWKTVIETAGIKAE